MTVTEYTSPVVVGASHSFTVTAYDAFNNVATGYTGTVHITTGDTHAVLPGDYTFTSGDAGVHTLSATYKTVGTYTLTGTDTVTATITGAQTGIQVTPAGASTLTVAGYTSPTIAGDS